MNVAAAFFAPLVLAALLTLAPGCEGGDGDACPDGDVSIALECPTEVDAGCVPEAGAVVGDFGVEARSCGGVVEAVCDPAEGSTFAPGETTVTCEARDATSGEPPATCELTVVARPEGSFSLRCHERVSVECQGSLTPADVPLPEVVALCGSPTGSIASDAPAGGYPAPAPTSETTVTFSAASATGYEATCATVVEVVDTAAPELTCPAALTAVRTSADAAVAPPALAGLDQCGGERAATAAPAALARGTSTVTYTAADAAGNATSCSTPVTVLDAFAVTGLRVASASLPPGGATKVSLAWDPAGGDDAVGYRVERGPGPDGPWEALDTVGLEALVHTDPALADDVTYYRVVTLAAGGVDGGAATLRAYALAGGTYDLRDQRVPTVTFATTLYGVARHPRALADGPFPLVLLLHGNHGNCRPPSLAWDDECSETTDHDCHWWGYTTTPNAEGLVYLAETLAAQGVVAASLSGNALNCRDDYIGERAELVIEHLRRWAGWATAGGSPLGVDLAGAVDTTRVGLVGHSRGGEAVALVPSRLAATPVAGVTVASVFSIAPTDYHGPVPDGVEYAVLLPGCDGDVYTLEGMHIYDRALADPAAGVARSQVFFPRANHNFFSTEWRFDDNGWGLVCATSVEAGDVAQQRMLEATLGAWFQGTLIATGTAALEGFLQAQGPTPPGIDAWVGTSLDLRWSHAAGSRLVIDDLSDDRAPAMNLLGLPNAFTGFTTARVCSEAGCDTSFPHRRTAVLLSWEEAAGVATWSLGGLDASAGEALSFRVVSRNSGLNAGLEAQEFLVRLRDTGGAEIEVLLSSLARVPHLYQAYNQREVLQTVRLPLDEVRALSPELDLGALGELEIETSVAGHESGSVILTDVELAIE